MCHVLIIEDEPLIAMSIEDTLRDAGATSFSFAVTEDDAVMEAKAHKPEFITSDMKLIEGLGSNAVVRIQQELGPIPAVIITGNLESPVVGEPPIPVLRKPVAPGTLAKTFKALKPH